MKMKIFLYQLKFANLKKKKHVKKKFVIKFTGTTTIFVIANYI